MSGAACTMGSTTSALVAGSAGSVSNIARRRGSGRVVAKVSPMTVAGRSSSSRTTTRSSSPRRASLTTRRGFPSSSTDAERETVIQPIVVDTHAPTPETETKDDVDEWFPPFADFVPKLTLMGLGAGLMNTGFELDGPASTIEAIAVLASIITVHECGHFFAARLQNIHVSKFSVGFGPNLLSYKGPEVEYSLRWVPLGGFVAFPDDDPDCPYPEDDPDLLRNRPIKDRAIVITAGVLANVAFALAILNYQVNTVGLVEQAYRPGVKVAQLLSTSAAREYGVKVGDVITAIDGESLPAAGRSVNDVVAKVKAAGSNPVRLKIDRQNAPPVDIEVVPKTGVNGEGRIGVQLEANAEVRKRIASDPAEGLFLASKEFGRLTGLVCKSLFSLVSNFSQAKDNVSGPIAIVGVGAEVMRGADASGLYQFASVININLAVVNILPLPALDGGFLLLIVIEALRGGKKLPAEVEQSITASGVLLLLGSGMFLILRDTLNLVGNLGQH